MTNFLSLRKQKGMSTLMITVILLSVLLMVSLFASRFQVFEQRASVNKVRAAMTQSITDSAINQGLEYLKANSRYVSSTKEAVGAFPAGWLSASTPLWVPCSKAVASGEFDPCLAEENEDRRSQMYRFVRNSKTRLPIEDVLGTKQTYTKVAGRDATYNLYATLCRLDTTSSPGTPICSLEPSEEGPVAITVVAHGQLPGQKTSSTTKAIIASSRIVSSPPNVPLIAAGFISGLGSAEIIPNPNAGGFGVPLSIWTNNNVDVTKEIGGGGAFATCHLGEFLSNYSGNAGPVQYDGITKCVNCTCSGLPPDRGLISGKDPGTPGYEGIDIMDVDNNANGDLPDTSYFPQYPLDKANNNFDDSVFEYTFGVDTQDRTETAPRTNCVSTDNPTGNCENQFLIDVGAQVITSCAALNASSSGLYWVKGDCDINQAIGTPSYPVAIVVDKCLNIRGQTEFYGLMFTRGGGPGGCSDPDRTFNAAGGGQIYGSVVSSGGVKIRGSVQIIYNDTVLKNLGNSPAFQRYGFLPGSWSDNVCSATAGVCK